MLREHLGATRDKFVGVSVVLHSSVDPANLEGSHYVLGLKIVTCWEGPEEFMDFDSHTVKSSPVGFRILGRRWSTLGLANLRFEVCKNLIEDLQRVVLLELVQAGG